MLVKDFVKNMKDSDRIFIMDSHYDLGFTLMKPLTSILFKGKVEELKDNNKLMDSSIIKEYYSEPFSAQVLRVKCNTISKIDSWDKGLIHDLSNERTQGGKNNTNTYNTTIINNKLYYWED